ncbi:hypothetical protein C8J57DRAFT_1619793 [Mycena rebaudengoi]|nr:hypothetical protein C8J57DRAFT_1619793 [Mycena rebaudengoi]
MTRWIPDPTDMAPLVKRSDCPTLKNLTEKSSEFAPVVDWPATVTKLAKKWENLSETFEPANTASDTMSEFLAMRLVERAVKSLGRKLWDNQQALVSTLRLLLMGDPKFATETIADWVKADACNEKDKPTEEEAATTARFTHSSGAPYTPTPSCGNNVQRDSSCGILNVAARRMWTLYIAGISKTYLIGLAKCLAEFEFSEVGVAGLTWAWLALYYSQALHYISDPITSPTANAMV